MESSNIRQKFFDFFIKRSHEKVPSSSLIPAEDPTLLFTNAGMNQFKDVFVGKEKRNYNKAVSIQKCMRAGGKHNDLSNVGFTKRHLTFFEMMGNFSFGDYFKKEAIEYAWEFLTKEVGLPSDKLYASVYKTDDEAYDIWHKTVGLPPEKIYRLGEADNFWQMGDTGPCGPCSEIHIDRGPEHGCKDIASCGPACDCDRFIEIWNLVFMQYDRQPDGTDVPLKKTGVDTGMGFERLCMISQQKDSVFEIDIFAPILQKIEQLTGKKYADQQGQEKAAFHVLADHIRATSMLIADGCLPSNEGRGYVLRKIIRRAALFAQKLTDKTIFPQLSQVVVEEFGKIYPELQTHKKLIRTILEDEVEKFSANLVRGKNILEKHFQEDNETKIISGEQAFKLYDTYGFPIELVDLIASERGFSVDYVGFEQEMAKQQEQSGQKKADELANVRFDSMIETEFTGYDELETSSKIIALVHDAASVKTVSVGQTCFVITKKSPFYIASGGQVDDHGWLQVGDKKIQIKSLRKLNGGIATEIVTPTELKVGDKVTAIVDKERRNNIRKNHTATHLLQAALMKFLGKQVKQSGSFVEPDYLRFDFIFNGTVKPEEVKHIEDLVNRAIQDNIPVTVETLTMDEATKRGAVAFFADKYNPDNVRMVSVPGISTELCGGTHVSATGNIGLFKITDVVSPAAGHRRIFAVTGPKAVELMQESFNLAKTLSQEFSVQRDEVVTAVLKQKEQIKELQKTVKKLKKEFLKAQLPIWEQQVELVNEIPFLFLHLDDVSHEELKDIASHLNSKKPGFYFFTGTVGGKPIFLCNLGAGIGKRLNLKDFASWLKDEHDLRGGGAKNILQGGGAKFEVNLEGSIKSWMHKNLKH